MFEFHIIYIRPFPCIQSLQKKGPVASNGQAHGEAGVFITRIARICGAPKPSKNWGDNNETGYIK
jgi:hypothetical protein